jgi:hypothetical protein
MSGPDNASCELRPLPTSSQPLTAVTWTQAAAVHPAEHKQRPMRRPCSVTAWPPHAATLQPEDGAACSVARCGGCARSQSAVTGTERLERVKAIEHAAVTHGHSTPWPLRTSQLLGQGEQVVAVGVARRERWAPQLDLVAASARGSPCSHDTAAQHVARGLLGLHLVRKARVEGSEVRPDGDVLGIPRIGPPCADRAGRASMSHRSLGTQHGHVWVH